MSSNTKNGGNLDTGSGGFPVGDGGDRYTYDVGVPDDGDRTKWNAGKINVDKTNKDLSKSTKKTLASYLSDTTLGKTPSAATQKPNSFPVDAAEVNEIRLNDESGNVTSPHETTNRSKFVGWGSMTSRSAVATQQTLNIQRGRQTVPGQSNPVDGNRLLRDATVEGAIRATAGIPIGTSVIDGKIPAVGTTVLDDNSPLASYSRSLVKNRFNPDNTYETLSSNKLDGGQFAKSYVLGQSQGPEDERDITFGRLAQLGNSLSIRSGLELFSADAGNNPSSAATEAGAILPGWPQMGVKRIESFLLNAEDVIEDLSPDGIKEENLIDPMTTSWGTLNNVHDQYAGISNFGMQLLAVALIVALSVVIGLMSILFLMPGPHSTPKQTDSLGRYAYGAYEADTSGGNFESLGGIVKAIISGKFNFWKVLGIVSTKFPQKQCLPVGALAFFGVKAPEVSAAGMASAAAGAALSVAQSPGYYAIMARNVNRSFLLIKDSFESIGKSFGLGASSGVNLASAVKQLLGLIDTLKNSKFIRAVNIFSQLGDRILRDSSVDEQFASDKASIGSGIRHLGILDINPNLDAAQRSRINVAGAKAGISALTLAWSSHRAPDLLMIPAGVAGIISPRSIERLGVPQYRHTISIDKSAGVKRGHQLPKNGDTRLSTELREQIEDELESEYVPFYFHDIRTNEIVSFHAFLASLSDDYTSSYDSVDAFGRVEPIKTYKGTQRKIGVSFYVVATSPNDFDTMWIKINKLTTLLYPQFSEGRTLIDETNKYKIYAPFSQTIQASPLIRLRIGDLIKSNYSKFNLARLFGYSYSETQFGGKNSYSAKFDSLDKSYEDLVQEALDVKRKTPGSKFLTASRLYSPVTEKDQTASLPLPIPTNQDPPPDSHPLYKGLILVVKDSSKYQGINDDEVVCQVIKAPIYELKNMEMTNADYEKLDQLKELGPDKNIIGQNYKFRKTDLIPTPLTEEKLLKEVSEKIGNTSAGEDGYTDNVDDFMNDDFASNKGNAIVKSFRSSGGKGLAGFIESLSFDWYDKATWEIGRGVESPGPIRGRVAPKMCKVTISFTPIHDITPGLDHVGGNRAPVYPVGPLYSKDYKNK